MNIAKTIFSCALSVLLGAVFIYSGYTKLLPVIETFEFTFVDAGVSNWYTAPVFARVLIGFEFFIGTLLLLCYNLRILLKLSIAILAFFILYLIVQIVLNGNSGSCGCFGEHLPMSPLEGIIKNVIMIILSFIALKSGSGWTLKRNKLVMFVMLILTLSVPFVLNPIDYSYSSNNLEEKINYPLELDLLYHPEDSSKVEIPKVELRKGKHVLAFLSLSCSHCRVAAKKFRLIKKNNPAIPIYFVLNGDKEKLKAFHEDTRSENIPYSFCLGKTFIQLASAQLPRIYYLDNGIVVRKVDYFELNQYEIEKWIEQK